MRYFLRHCNYCGEEELHCYMAQDSYNGKDFAAWFVCIRLQIEAKTKLYYIMGAHNKIELQP